MKERAEKKHRIKKMEKVNDEYNTEVKRNLGKRLSHF